MTAYSQDVLCALLLFYSVPVFPIDYLILISCYAMTSKVPMKIKR